MYKTLIVSDKCPANLSENFVNVISFDTYLHDYPKLNEPKIRIINLCDPKKYLSEGYYCSLLAEARNHRVLPSVKTINEMRGGIQLLLTQKLASKDELAALQNGCANDGVYIFWGVCSENSLASLAKKLFRQYPAPILKLSFYAESRQLRLERTAFDELPAAEQQIFIDILLIQGERWSSRSSGKSHRWDMAILVNPAEPNPPSNKGALQRFVKAAAKLGIRAQTLTANELIDINQYDALFIRETTAINHHTYALASEAENNGVVVLDDPSSILRCCNKVYLHDAFNYQKIPSPLTEIIDNSREDKLTVLEESFGYPMILKMPESSFSKGVFKVDNKSGLQQKLSELLQDSALALVQEYLYTEFDWRIGILNGQAIYACQYFMAPKHWQIYNHESKRSIAGAFATIPTFEVPRTVLNAALRASRIVGNGLYGVDIKVYNDKPFVMEVNDNPNIDHKVEDACIGEELYMQIMAEFLRRLEQRGR